MKIRGELKTVIYLDQNVISNITKALDPDFPRRDKVIEEGWLDVYKKIERLRRLQLVVSPECRFRRAESLLSTAPSYDSLQDVYSYLSSGCVFQAAWAILELQILLHFRNYLDGQPDQEPAIGAGEVILGELDAWEDLIAVSIQYRPSTTDRQTHYDQRRRSEEHLQRASRLWQNDELSFERIVQEEVQECSRALIESINQDLDKLRNPTCPLDLLPSAGVRLFCALGEVLRDSGVPEHEHQKLVVDYLRHPCFSRVPFVRLSAMLSASLARKTQAGQRRPPNRGTVTDISAIASVLPYCGGMFVDNEMATCLREAPLSGEVETLGTRVFSPRTKGAFMTFLAGLEAAAGPLREAVIKQHYGADWLDPYLDVVVAGRELRSPRCPAAD